MNDTAALIQQARDEARAEWVQALTGFRYLEPIFGEEYQKAYKVYGGVLYTPTTVGQAINDYIKNLKELLKESE